MSKRVYRSKEDKIITGVLAGLAERFSQDPTIVRIGFVLIALLTAVIPFVLLYFIAAIITPEKPEVTYRVVE